MERIQARMGHKLEGLTIENMIYAFCTVPVFAIIWLQPLHVSSSYQDYSLTNRVVPVLKNAVNFSWSVNIILNSKDNIFQNHCSLTRDHENVKTSLCLGKKQQRLIWCNAILFCDTALVLLEHEYFKIIEVSPCI